MKRWLVALVLLAGCSSVGEEVASRSAGIGGNAGPRPTSAGVAGPVGDWVNGRVWPAAPGEACAFPGAVGETSAGRPLRCVAQPQGWARWRAL